MKTGGGLYPHHQDKDRPVLPIFIGYRTDLIPPPPRAEFSLIFGITAIITVSLTVFGNLWSSVRISFEERENHSTLYNKTSSKTVIAFSHFGAIPLLFP